ncbi:DNRLRE domain-containing protein [Streptomyces sp. IGB124]|uniref:DNRLRE domain-containing protein n=1 Tax=Streptomyces sp. IGB124 TaxID=1519485 RepID=UPI00131D9EF1|nr:DNRLRE domain-containing protein [Streptomyces sp. IGB124]
MVVSTLTPPAAAAPQAPSASTSTEAPDEASALLAARLNKRRIEVTGARTETTTLWANPDGTLTRTTATGPVRMKVGDAWVPVDTTLVVAADGTVAPKAHPEGLVFSGGDAGVTVGDALAPAPSPAPTKSASASPSVSASPAASPSAVPQASAAAAPTATPAAEASPSALPSPSASASDRASRFSGRATLAAAEPVVPAERDLAKVGTGDKQVELGWLGKLPKPALSGSKATYVNARPGVDLVLEATRTGFEQYLLIKDRSAVSQAGTLTLPIDTTGFKVARQRDGAIHLLDPGSGQVRVEIPAPVMWDAAVDAGSGEHLHRAPVGMELRGEGKDAELVLTPDAKFLADARTQFPITVDPAVNVTPTFDTFVQTNVGTGQSTATELKLGTYDGGSTVARSFMHFPESSFHGKQILGATLNLYNSHSYSCTASEWEVWDTDRAGSGTVWSQQPTWKGMWTRSSETQDTDSGDGHQCASTGGWVKADVRALVEAWSDNGNYDNALGVRARYENDSKSWKRFSSAEGGAPPYLSVTYNSIPAAPQTDLTPSVPGTIRWTSSGTPSLTSYAVDGDPGGDVWADFELWTSEGLVKAFNRLVPNGTVVAVTPSDFGLARLEEDKQYAFRSRVYDHYVHSPWSPDLTVRADTAKPGAPFVTSADYPSDSAWHGKAGQAGNFTFTTPSGTTDALGYVYTLDGAAPVTVAGTSAATVQIAPAADGHRVLKVQTKDRAGNLSDPTTYTFQVGQAGLTSPADGSQSAKRVKLSVDAQAQYKRVVYQYRRGPGATEYDVPIANLTRADNSPVIEAKPRLSDLGAHANWTVVDTLGAVGGVVQVRALLFPEDGSGTGYATGWNTMTVDRNADGAAGTEVGPGSVNLLTGDYSTDVTDADEFGMSVARATSSRGTDRGWQAQGERLTANQQKISTDMTGFTSGQAALSRSTVRGHDNSTDSLLVEPSSGTDTYAALGPEYTLGQSMKAGRTYRLTGWIYVPAATGLSPAMADRGLRLVGFHKNPAGYTAVPSAKAGFTDGWQQLSVDMAVPKDATEAWFRLYNGFAGGSGKQVFFDDLSLKEIVAPFGPQWAGGPDAGGGSEYRALAFPQSDVAEIKLTDDSVLTFAKAQDGTLWPEPGAENLTLKASGSNYTLTDLDGSVTVFTKQTGSDVFQVVSETGPDAASSTRYIYDATDGRALPKRVVAPVEPGVDDTNHCTVDPLPRGCEVMDYDYATATTAVPGTPGDFIDRVKSVKVWSWNPVSSQQEAVEVTRYLYDEGGRLVQVWDPRLAPPLKTSYSYDAAGRVTRIAPAGELPWDFDYGPAGSDQDPGRLLKVRRGALAPGSKDQVSGEIRTKVVYNVPLTRSAGGPYDMSGADVAKWAQIDAPTDATAVFGPQDEPGTSTATQSVPGSDGYKPANVHYLNASGNEVNTAAPSVTASGDIDTSEYDRFGHVVRTLEATNRSIALGTHPDSARFVSELNLPAAAADRARLLDSRTTYTPDGMDVKETLGPAYRASLTEAVAGQATPVNVFAEAENLVQLGATAPIRTDANGCCGLAWSGAGQLGIRGTKTGDYDTMRITVPEEGEYALSGQLTLAADHGVFQWSIGGQNIGSPIDGYAANASVQPYNTGTSLYLARGDHELKLTFTGTNPASTGERYHAGIDTVILTKSKLNDPIAAGTPVVVRDHNTSTYDEGKPDGQAYHLVTTETDGARIDGYADDVEIRVTKNGYDTPIGGTSGWTLKTPTSVTTNAGAGGASLTATIKYDASGRALESRKPGATGTDATTVKSVFYTAGTNTVDAACGNRPEWAGSPCVTLPGGAITGADSARMPTTLPVKRITRYSRFGDAEETTETNAGKTRKAVTVFDGADRIVSTEITSDEGLALPKVTTEYDASTGDIVKTTAGAKSLTRVFDALGRLMSYTDADGGTTTTEFDAYGKPTKVTDPTGSTTYTYDRAKEPRGMVTSINDSVAGEFTAKYGPDGQLTEQTYPGGIARKDATNAAGAATSRTYTRMSDGSVIWSQNIDVSTQGAVAKDTSTSGTRAYTYDRLGRLTKAEQTTTAFGCVTRQYTFDSHSNRLAKATSPAVAGACSTDSPVTENHTYDSADRLTDEGFMYDAFGRTTKTATGATNTYWANDKVAAQEKADTKQEWTVDPAHRLTGFTTAKKQANGTWANATSKLNHYGDDSDEVRWVIEDTTQGTLTRNVSGPDSDLAATTSKTGDIQLQLTNLMGSVVVTTDTALTQPVVLDFDEFGIPQDGQANVRYGWLGGKQRSAEALDGDILMGARLYSPALGRFLQVDPIPGGNASPYDYCTGDPINCTDLDGNWGFSFKKVLKSVARVAEVASYIPGPIGGIAAAVSSASYAATGNWRKAGEMAVTAAASLVGANTAVKAGFAAARAIRASSRVSRVASRAKSAFRARPASCPIGNSFTPETPVVMADGRYVPISEIEVGDLVIAADLQSGETASKPVLDVIVGYGTRHLVEIVTGSDVNAVPVTATFNHPFWVAGKGWTEAGEIKAGDLLRSSSGATSVVSSTADLGDVPDQLVFNLNVGDLHTFAIQSGGSDAVVHNCNKNQGVYVFRHLRRGNKLYIGKASNFKNRFRYHVGKGNVKSIKDAHCFHVCGSNDDLFVAEHRIMQQFKKRHKLANRSASPGKKILAARLARMNPWRQGRLF